jgi:hypothetical protein
VQCAAGVNKTKLKALEKQQASFLKTLNLMTLVVRQRGYFVVTCDDRRGMLSLLCNTIIAKQAKELVKLILLKLPNKLMYFNVSSVD